MKCNQYLSWQRIWGVSGSPAPPHYSALRTPEIWSLTWVDVYCLILFVSSQLSTPQSFLFSVSTISHLPFFFKSSIHLTLHSLCISLSPFMEHFTVVYIPRNVQWIKCKYNSTTIKQLTIRNQKKLALGTVNNFHRRRKKTEVLVTLLTQMI